MRRLSAFLLILLMFAAVTQAAPPDNAEVPPAPEQLTVDSAQGLPETPALPERPGPVKLVEITIDDEGIRGIDEFGNEVILEGASEFERDADRDIGGCTESVTEIGDYFVSEDEEVNANLTVVGNVYIDGVVYCDIIASKTVVLSETAEVYGNIWAQSIDQHPNSRFYGTYRGSIPLPDLTPTGLPGLGAWIITSLFLILFGMLFVVIFQKPVARVRYTIETGMFKSLLVGFLIFLAILPVFILLVITIIGIPVAVIVYPLALAGAIVLGQIGMSYYLGGLAGRVFSPLKFDSIFMRTIVGICFGMFPWYLSGFFESVGITGLSIFFFVIGIIFAAFITLTGLGTIWFTRFGTRPLNIDIDEKHDMRAGSEAAATSG